MDGRRRSISPDRHWENTGEGDKQDLGDAVDTEPKDKDRQERYFGRRKSERDDRIEHPLHETPASHRDAKQHTGYGRSKKAGEFPEQTRGPVGRNPAAHKHAPTF